MPDNSTDTAAADWLDPVARELRHPVALGNGYLDRTLAALQSRPARSQRLWRPVAARALAAGLLAAVSLGLFGPGENRGAPVRFVIEAPAGAVALVGDFNDWNPQTLKRQDGAWSVTLRLPPGRYRYAFVVDGDHWLNDPSHPVAQDEFGTPTSVITVAN